MNCIIIGAGIAGLSAGCYAQMNGYNSGIYELNTLPGGLCMSWVRGEYTFDGCIDWMTGSASDGMMYPLWREVGAIANTRFLYHDEYCRFEMNGHTVVLYLNPDRLQRELLSHAPEDSEAIAELCGLIRALKGFAPNVQKPLALYNSLDYIKMMLAVLKHGRQYPQFLKYGKISMSAFADRFQNEFISKMLRSIWGEDFPVSLFASTMAWCANKTAGYPEGGSLVVAKNMERRYRSLGGTIHYKSKVEKILVEDGKAVGIALSDGTQHRADAVISAADGYATIHKMLDGKYTTDTIEQWYAKHTTFPPYIQVSLGVKRDMQNIPRMIYQWLDIPLIIADQEMPYMILHNYAYDKTLAPEGKTSLAVRFFTDYNWWRDRYSDKKRYHEAKKALAEAVAGALEKMFPGIKDDIEVVDVATPMTYVRYTDTWKGATMSWLPTVDNFSKSLDATLPGLNNFYMAGQWLIPGGGIPNALKTGRDAVQIMCKKDKKKFITRVE